MGFAPRSFFRFLGRIPFCFLRAQDQYRKNGLVASDQTWSSSVSRLPEEATSESDDWGIESVPSPCEWNEMRDVPVISAPVSPGMDAAM